MEAVNGNKFFRECKWSTMMIHFGSGDTTHDFPFANPAPNLMQLFAHQSPPVGVHRDLQCRMWENRGRPLHCMDLGHECAIDQSCSVKYLVTCPVRKMIPQFVADGIVLKSKYSVQQLKASPPIVHKPGDRNPSVISWQVMVSTTLFDIKLPIGRLAPQHFCQCFTGTIDLGAIPPVGILVFVSRKLAVYFIQWGIRKCLVYDHLWFGPVIAFGQWNLHIFGAVKVSKPIVDHKLYPWRCE